MKTQCPKCKAAFHVEDKYVGKSANCPTCGESFIIEPVVEYGVEARQQGAIDATSPPPQPVGVAQAQSTVPPPPPSAPPAEALAAPGVFVSPMPRAKLAIGFLVAAVIISLIAIWSSSLQLDLLTRIAGGEEIPPDVAEANNARETVVGLLSFGIFVTALVLFFCWEYRAYKNLGPLQAPRMRFSPGGSVGWYFCPIVNLWKPVQAMGDIARGSAPPGAQSGGLISALVPLWWLIWIADGVLAHASLRLTVDAESWEEFITATKVDIASSVVSIASYALTACLVWLLASAQVKRWQSLTAAPAIGDDADNPYAGIGG